MLISPDLLEPRPGGQVHGESCAAAIFNFSIIFPDFKPFAAMHGEFVEKSCAGWCWGQVFCQGTSQRTLLED